MFLLYSLFLMAAFGGTIYSKQPRKAKKSNNNPTYERPTYDRIFYIPTVNVDFVPEYLQDSHELAKLKDPNGMKYFFIAITVVLENIMEMYIIYISAS